MATAVLDTVVAAETPEGILLELHPAGLCARFYALVLDWLIRLVVVYGVAILTAFMGGLGAGFWLIFYFVLEWFYPVIFELGQTGATPGKKIVGLKVVMDNGLPVTPAASFARNLFRVADFLPLAFGFAIVSMLLRSDCKRLGDIVAATIVVHQPRKPPKVRLHEVAAVAPAMALTRRDQAALVALAARAPTLTVERLDELAALAAPVAGAEAGVGGPHVTRRVLGVAQWLLGRRT
jgi:uncharacterized RDD family membrane protein YckC